MPCLMWTTSLCATFLADNLLKMQVGSMGRGGLCDREARLTRKTGHYPIITATKDLANMLYNSTLILNVLSVDIIPPEIPPLRRRKCRCDPHRPPFSSGPSLSPGGAEQQRATNNETEDSRPCWPTSVTTTAAADHLNTLTISVWWKKGGKYCHYGLIKRLV